MLDHLISYNRAVCLVGRLAREVKKSVKALVQWIHSNSTKLVESIKAVGNLKLSCQMLVPVTQAALALSSISPVLM